MTEEIRRLQREQADVHQEMVNLRDKASKEKRGFTDEEDQKWAELNDRFDELARDIEQRKLLAEREQKLNEIEDPSPRPEPENEDREDKRGEQREAAFRSFLKQGVPQLTYDERRALQIDSDAAGGFIVAPEQFVNRLIKKVDDDVFFRQWATVIPAPNADSLGAPELAHDPDDGDWTAEIKTGAEDTTMDFGKRKLTPHPLAKRIKVSEPLLRKSLLNVEDLVRDRFAYKFAVTHEKACLTGSGSEQPLGIFTASDLGITTARDVSTDNQATSVTADGLINAVYALKSQYLRNARWLFHRDAMKQIRKLKDGNGQYLWQAGLAHDRPSTILDLPYAMSEYVPNTFTTGQYVGIVGDFSFYWIVDALNMRIQRLNELYAETNQVGFIGRLESDGMPVLEEAFVRVKLA